MIRFLVMATWLALLAGCATYAPKPLDSAAHLMEWRERSENAEAVRAFADRLGSAPDADHADGTTLARAEIVALVFSPELRAERAKADVAQAMAEHAGRWDDPSLSFDLMHVLQNVPDPWVIGGMVSFTLPLSGRLTAEKAAANSEHELALRRVAETEWRIVSELRSTWAQWSAARLHAEQLDELIARIDDIVMVVDRLEQAAALSRLEGRLFRMERAARRSERVLVQAQAEQLELELKSLMGLVPDAPIRLLPQVVAADADALVLQDAFELLETRSPALATLRAAHDVAEGKLQVEVRKQYPDVQLGPAYEWDEGQSKIGFGAGIPLPVFNANRQGIAAAEAERHSARVAYETAHERLVSRLAQARSRWQASRAAREMIESELLPLAEAQINDERRIAELGELNVLLTLESVVRAHDTKSQLVSARLAEAEAGYAVLELLGPNPIAPSGEEMLP